MENENYKTASPAAPVGQPMMTTDAAHYSSTSAQQSYAKELPIPVNHDARCYEGCLTCFGQCCGFFGMCRFPCCCFPNPFRIVEQGYVGLVTRFGRYYKTVDPGLTRINVMTERIQNVAVKIQIETIPTQTVMTKDNVNIIVDSVVYWEILHPEIASFMVADVRKAIVERTQTTLRHIIGTRALQDCIENRETLAHEIQEIIAQPAKTWGVKIESMLIKDLQFSVDLQETLSAAAKQKRIGESKVILARAEVESAKLMREASDILNTPAAMQIRYLETLNSMAKAANTKVIFMPGTNGNTSSSSNGAFGNSGNVDMTQMVQAKVMQEF